MTRSTSRRQSSRAPELVFCSKLRRELAEQAVWAESESGSKAKNNTRDLEQSSSLVTLGVVGVIQRVEELSEANMQQEYFGTKYMLPRAHALMVALLS